MPSFSWQLMDSQIFPIDFPPELGVAAFKNGNEAAWSAQLALAAVAWLSIHGYAVLGTELWLLQEPGTDGLPIGLSGQPEVNGKR